MGLRGDSVSLKFQAFDRVIKHECTWTPKGENG